MSSLTHIKFPCFKLSWAGAKLRALLLVPKTSTAYFTFWQFSWCCFTAPPEISWLCWVVSGSKHKSHCCLSLWFLGNFPEGCFSPCFATIQGGEDFCFSVRTETLTTVRKIQPGAYAARLNCSHSDTILLPPAQGIRTRSEKKKEIYVVYFLYGIYICCVKF